MSGSSPESLARAAWDAVSAGDVNAIHALVSEDVVWHASGRGSRAGDYHGPAGILDYLAGIGESAEDFDVDLDDILIGAERVALLFRVFGRRQGRLLEAGFVLLMRIEEERITEVWSIARDQHAVDEFWA